MTRTGGTFLWASVILVFVAATILVFISWLPDVTGLAEHNPQSTEYVQFYVNRLHRRGDMPAVRMHWVPLRDISPHLRHAVRLAEDDRFLLHRGVDWVELKKALRYNIKKRRLARGASTITQQVARNLFMKPSRGTANKLRRKVKEILIAPHLERKLGKDRIMEIYLNIAEWGEGVFGAEAASLVYFDKHAAELTPEEAVALAAALPSPYRWNPSVAPDERTQLIREHYLRRMYEEGYLPQPRGVREDLDGR
ncbi:MAG: biosynthetic peptidoglycan transglycosylase [Elusimicrobiota bacterium]